MIMYEKKWKSSNELKYSFLNWVDKMASSYKSVHYILPLQSASLYCSSCIKLGAAVWYYDKTSDIGIDIYYKKVCKTFTE